VVAAGKQRAAELARTELCLGERLRRGRQPRAARGRLSRALLEFERLSAAPWAARARHELDATAITARQRHAGARDELSLREFEVATIVAQGSTNREAAARLFLSTKTIEAHLQRVYPKLDVHNRAQLVNALRSLPES
jgi:DNA-binding NarL/FixJ family response regulator